MISAAARTGARISEQFLDIADSARRLAWGWVQPGTPEATAMLGVADRLKTLAKEADGVVDLSRPFGPHYGTRAGASALDGLPQNSVSGMVDALERTATSGWRAAPKDIHYPRRFEHALYKLADRADLVETGMARPITSTEDIAKAFANSGNGERFRQWLDNVKAS